MNGADERPHGTASDLTFFLLALAAGAGAANLYYAQPLIALISADIGLDESIASLVVTLGQIGYIAGLLLVVPLGDTVENRRLLGLVLVCACIGLIIAASAHAPLVFAGAALVYGLGSVVAQVAVPFASHLARPEERGRKVGNVVAGLMAGIMLARPAASLIAHAFGWRAVFLASAALMAALAVGLRLALPARHPHGRLGMLALIGSFPRLLRSQPVLRRRIAYQLPMFGAFILFWTAVPLELAGPRFGLDQRGIALFALAGAAGVFGSSLAGRLADRGHARLGTGIALVSAVAGFLIAATGVAVGSVVVLAIGAVVLDLAAAANLVFGQRALFMLDPAIRSRLNALYIALFFFGGAIGSALASPLYVLGGWPAVSAAGIVVMLAALGYFATEGRGGTA
ncbi:MFS transporter [Ancylobacter sonchi]|uniref:MFS transporter n=1 Tax=Ancylobacter sonchi TaxID=1937790 RepID=UPI001BD2C721|nr:MFS transporter [Ancylobacter sonchi]MBS7536346.1 MFS transporter [Ancylobacter sonchi]